MQAATVTWTQTNDLSTSGSNILPTLDLFPGTNSAVANWIHVGSPSMIQGSTLTGSTWAAPMPVGTTSVNVSVKVVALSSTTALSLG